MATKKVKWYQKDGTLLHPETEWSMIVGAPEYPDVSKLVTTDTEQEITAKKKFIQSIDVYGGGIGVDDDADAGAVYHANGILVCAGGIPNDRVSGDGDAYWLYFPYKNGTIATTADIPKIPSLSVTNSGSGNAVTGISVNGHAITVTKGSQFALKSDIPNTSKFVTTDTEQTITARKAISSATSSNSLSELGIQIYNSDKKDTAYAADGIYINDDGNGGNGVLRFPTKTGTIATTADITWPQISDRPSWIGENKPSYTKSEVGLGNVTNDAQVKRTEMGVANGVATLDAQGKVPNTQLPSYVDDVLEYDKKTSFPETGEDGKIYVAEDTNITYRWSGTAYVEISPSLALGETAQTAYAGNKGKANADAIAALQKRVGNVESNYVTTDTEQRITGKKIFGEIEVVDSIEFMGMQIFPKYFVISSEETESPEEITMPTRSGKLALVEDIKWANLSDKPTIPDVSKYLPLAGGTLTGNLKVGSATIQTNGYITGTWLQTTSPATHSGSAATKVAIIDGSGWIYHRTPAELLSDMGGASTSYVDTKVANIVNSAPETLDTLNELAKALGNDPNFATTVSTQIGQKADKTSLNAYLPLSGGTMAGALKFAQSACSDADGPSYLLAMTSFSSGGEVKYTHVRNLTSKGNLQWTSATHTNATGYLFDGNYIPTINTLAYWNGAYQNTSSNLTYCTDGEILSKNGGTLTANAQIQRAGKSVTWVNGRDGAVLRTTSSGTSTSAQYCPIFSQKTVNGSWEFGAYTSDIAHLSYITDANHTAGKNEQTADYQFAANKKGEVAVITDITWANTSGKPSWIGSTKPSYTWSEIGSKPSWIGSSKPSYSYSEISGTPTSLKNPSSLSITVNGTTITYDGSSAKSISITTGGSKLDAYPVGIIVAFYNSTKPATAFGGSWQHMGARFLYGASSETASVGGTGGSATHTMTTSEMPQHTHTINLYTGTAGGSGRYVTFTTKNCTSTQSPFGTSGGAGSGQAFSILPPYTVVHYWRRTA